MLKRFKFRAEARHNAGADLEFTEKMFNNLARSMTDFWIWSPNKCNFKISDYNKNFNFKKKKLCMI